MIENYLIIRIITKKITREFDDSRVPRRISKPPDSPGENNDDGKGGGGGRGVKAQSSDGRRSVKYSILLLLNVILHL